MNLLISPYDNYTPPKIVTAATILLLLLALASPSIGLLGILTMWFTTKWKMWVKILITIPFAVYFLLMFVGGSFVTGYAVLFRPFQVTGQAMVPTYNDGAYLMTKPYDARKNAINHGDIIVFKAPADPEKDFIKRVIALPGDTISLLDGEVILNGQKLDESSYVSNSSQTYPGAFLSEGESYLVLARKYFVMGDNRPYSADSREWGFVPEENIVSKASFCYWNCGK